MRSSADRGVGIDAQLISEIEVCINNSDTFLTRNFTQKEIVYCKSTVDPSSSFAGRWAAKEAVIKAISNCDTNENTRPLWKGIIYNIYIIYNISSSD
jgi:phosphopantetheine--protein transferase-like protein